MLMSCGFDDVVCFKFFSITGNLFAELNHSSLSSVLKAILSLGCATPLPDTVAL